MPNSTHDAQVPSPWLVGLLPWVIDLLFKTSFLNSFLGALLWGLLLVVYFAQAKLVDRTLRKYLTRLLGILGLFWTIGWLRSFSAPIEHPLKQSDSLYFLHGTFLVASTGMLFLVLVSSAAGIFKERQVNEPKIRNFKLGPNGPSPSLEGLLKLCSWSLELAKIFWFLGCALAVIAVAVEAAHDPSGAEAIAKWIKDPALWVVGMLAVVFVFSNRFIETRLKIKNRFKTYLFLSFFSLMIAITVMWIESRSSGHIQGEFLG